MIDPITAVSMATAAYNGIKSAIATGKEIHEMGATLSQWATSISDLDFAHRQAQNPPMFKRLFGASDIQQNALEVWGQKKKAEAMREELKTFISFSYGPSAWDEILRIEAEMRKQRTVAVYAAAERRQAILEWVVGIAAAICGIAFLTAILYVTGVTQDRW